MKTGRIEILREHLHEVIEHLPSLNILLIIPDTIDKDQLTLIAEHEDFTVPDSRFMESLPEYNIIAQQHDDGSHTNYRIQAVEEVREPTNGDFWKLFPGDTERERTLLVQWIGEGEYVLLRRAENCLVNHGRFTGDGLKLYLSQGDAEFMGTCRDCAAFGI